MTGDGPVRAWAPGRVNLIGEHTDYSGGLALPLAIDLGLTVTVTRQPGPGPVTLRSAEEPRPAVVAAGITAADVAGLEPPWARVVAAVAVELKPDRGFTGSIDSTLPAGAGLSSSAALELATALALGFTGSGRQLAELGQRAEHLATGVPCGLLDQLTVALGVAGHALLIDFTSTTVVPVALPPAARVVVVHSGQARTLVGSPYAERHASCATVAARIGPLTEATTAELAALDDPLLRRRARHVITENGRVRMAAEALAAGDLGEVGRLMNASHTSLRDDFEVSTPRLDALAERLRARPGVHGARLTGAGFGGCVVALAEPGALDPTAGEIDGFRAWTVEASGGARVAN